MLIGSRRTSPLRGRLLCGALMCAFPCAAVAQPTQFFDLGAFSAPASPRSASEYLDFSASSLFSFGAGDSLTVRWVRFEVTAPIAPPLFLDIDSRLYNIENLPNGLTYALYSNAGQLLALDDSDGSFPLNGAAGLSFGSTDFRVPADTPILRGQDGTLAPGVYWLALAAGTTASVVAGQTGWDVTTSTSYPLGFFEPGTYYLELSFSVGNTTPVDPPVNDLCANALVISENLDRATPVWTGTNAGALSDGDFPCYRNNVPPFDTKDVWFRYIPSATGIVEVTASGGAGGAATPMLDRYDDAQGCGSPSVQCVGGGSIVFDEGTRMTFPVVQGEPVLLALAVYAGAVGPMELNVNSIPPPCELVIPEGATSESELTCGEDINGGCNLASPAFDPIANGQTVTGTLFDSRTLRDTDWFEFTVDRPSRVNITYSAQAPSVVSVLARPDAPGQCLNVVSFFGEDSDYAQSCTTRTASGELEPGVYRAVIAHRFFDGLVCGLGYEQYWMRLDVEPTGACPADYNQDEGVDSDDVIAFFGDWDAGNSLADFNDDGGVDADDVIAFFARWDAGC